MRKATLKVFIAVMCLLSIPSFVEAQYVLTYSDGNIVNSSGASYGTETHELSAAMFLDAAKLAPVKGKKITKISVGLINMGSYPVTVYNDLKVFVNNDLGSTVSLASATLPKDEVKLNAWNEVVLETPFTIPDGALYIGYTIEANRLPIAYDGNTVLETPNATHQGEDGKWDANSGIGNLCIKAFVEEETPSCNVALIQVVAPEAVRKDAPFHIIGNVINKTAAKVESLKVVCKVGDEEIATTTVTGLSLGYDKVSAVDFSGFITNKVADNMKVSVQITEVNGQPDVDNSDNSASVSFSSKENWVQRKFLLEQFTSLGCSGCPAGTAALKSAVEGYEDQTVWVANHNGAYTDQYTIPESNYFASFYGTDLHAAPSVMFDRVNYSDLGATVATGGGSVPSVGPVFAVLNKDLLRNIVLLRSCEYSPVELAITQKYSGDGQLEVTVKGKTLSALSGIPAVSVFLTEDDLPGSETHGNQNAVIRYVANSEDYYCLGDPLTINADGNFETSYTIDLQGIAEGWNLSNVNVVAFVSNLDGGSDAINNNKVYNAEKVQLYDNGSVNGIDANAAGNMIRVYAQEGKVIVEGEAVSFNVYTIDGKMIANNNLPKGIYIVKIMNGKQTMTRKVQL